MTAESPRMFPRFVRTLENPGGAYLPEDKRRLSFYHIQKTAGSTFRYLLQNYFAPEEICAHETDWEIERQQIEDLRRYRFFAGHFRMETMHEHLADTVGVIFLRHPIDRFLSEFSMDSNPDRCLGKWDDRARELGHTDPSILEYLHNVVNMSLDDYFDWNIKRARNKYRNLQTRRLARITPHADTMPDWDEGILAEAKANLRERFVFCGLMEHFGLSVNLFCLTFGLLPYAAARSTLRNVNPLKSFGARYRISPGNLEFLVERNRMDLALYDYAKELMLERLEAFQAAAARHVRNHAPAGSAPAGSVPFSLLLEAGRLPAARGLHALEADGLGRAFHWTGGESEASVELDLPVPARAVTVSIEALAAINEHCASGLRFTVGGQAPGGLRFCRRQPDGMLVWEGRVELPAGTRGRRVHLLRIEAPRVAIATDARLLGIALHGIRVESA